MSLFCSERRQKFITSKVIMNNEDEKDDDDIESKTKPNFLILDSDDSYIYTFPEEKDP